MTPNTALHDALDGAYRAFSGYPRPVVLEAAPTRDGVAILRTLSAAPLRELSGEQIGPYSGWALTTVGDVLDYKHFLPRILEQAVRDDVWMGTSPSIIAERLKMAEWRSWPAAEQVAITDVFLCAWSQACEEHPNFSIASDWLCAIAALGEVVSPLLNAWLASRSLNAMLQIAEFASAATELISAAPDALAYWSYVDAPQRWAVATWMTSAPVRANLRAATEDAADEDRWLLDRAIAAVERAAARRPS